MSIPAKPSLALVSNYDDVSCGFAAYTRAREKGFSEFFDVTIFDLKSSTLMRAAGQETAAEAWIDATCARLGEFDLVVLDPEFGMWGATLEQCESRLLKCCRAARRLVVVMDRVDIDKTKETTFARAQAKILQDVARRPADRPYHLMTHGENELSILRSVHGFHDVSSHPIAAIPVPERAVLAAKADPAGWKQSLGFDAGAITVGLFGAFSKVKDAKTVLRALSHLPERYKLVFVGGAHPFTARPFLPDDNVTDLLETIAEIAAAHPGFAERVRFAGILSDDEFRQALQDCDYVVLPYHDAGQSTSGVTSNSFELGKRIVATRTKMFRSFQKMYGDCFEMYDVGNHLDLRDRLRYFDPAKEKRMKAAANLYTPSSLAGHVHQIALDLKRADFRNRCDMEKLDELVRSLEAIPASASGEGAISGDIAHLQRAYVEAVEVQDRLKAEKRLLEEERDRLNEELSKRRRPWESFWSLVAGRPTEKASARKDS